MNHPTNDELLLLAYGEAPEHEGHLARCVDCRSHFALVEEGKLLLELGSARSRARTGAAWIPVALAAGIVGFLMMAVPREQMPELTPHWRPTLAASPAGYVTDRELIELDAQLRRLEHGGMYGQD